MSVGTTVRRAGRQARRAGNSSWVDRGARVGFAGRGLLYLTVAFLAARIAQGRGGEQADKQGAVRALADTPLGLALLVVLVVGFAGYALWQAAEAAWGRRDEADDTKRTGKRGVSAAKALVYGALAATTLAVLFGRDETGARQESLWTARVLGLPGGRILVGLVGLAIVGAGGWLVVRGVRTKFDKHLDTRSMPNPLRKAAMVGGAVGHAARGVVVALAGLLLVKAAKDFNPQEAKGIDGTLRTIAQQPYGRVLLLLAAAGLAAFGLLSLVEARYRRL